MNRDSGISYAHGNTLRRCIEIIRQAQSIVITTHARPDGDALGSSLALKRMLCESGKEAHLAGLTPLPDRYSSFVVNGELDTPAQVLGKVKPDLLIALDAANIDRIPAEFRDIRETVTILNIDHHADNSLFGDINLVDSAASSAGELVFRLAKTAEYPLNRETAILLWIAMVTDTGRFTHENTTSEAMHTAAELLAFGLPTEDIDRRLYRSLKPAELELQKRVIESLEFHAEGKIAFATLVPEDFAAAGCGPEEINEVIEIPRSVAGVEIAVLFSEHEGYSGIKVSMRSNAPYDVREICCELGGGGHLRAAGCTLEMGMKSARKAVLNRLLDTCSGNTQLRSERE